MVIIGPVIITRHVQSGNTSRLPSGMQWSHEYQLPNEESADTINSSRVRDAESQATIASITAAVPTSAR